MRGSGNSRKAFWIAKDKLVRELATLLEAELSKVDKITYKLTMSDLLELQTLIGKRVVSERSKRNANAPERTS